MGINLEYTALLFLHYEIDDSIVTYEQLREHIVRYEAATIDIKPSYKWMSSDGEKWKEWAFRVFRVYYK